MFPLKLSEAAMPFWFPISILVGGFIGSIFSAIGEQSPSFSLLSMIFTAAFAIALALGQLLKKLDQILKKM